MMTKEQSRYVHPELGKHSRESLSLFLFLSNWQFAYTLLHEGSLMAYDKKPLLNQDPEESFFDWVRENEVLRQNYAGVEVFWCSPKFTLVPSPLFNEYQLEAYTRHLFQKEADEIIKFSSTGDMTGVFAINEKLYYALRSKFFEGRISHQFLANLVRVEKLSNDSERLFAFFYPAFFQLLHLDNGKLTFCNSFEFEKDEEAVYHVVNYYERMKLSRQRMPLYTAGLPSGSLSDLLGKYILQTQTLPLPDDLPAELAADIPNHSFLSLP